MKKQTIQQKIDAYQLLDDLPRGLMIYEAAKRAADAIMAGGIF
jgi:hypothetical protein